jgi:hypothetical protein
MGFSLAMATKDKREKQEDFKKIECDEEDEDLFLDSLERIDKIGQYIMEAVGFLLKAYKQEISPLLVQHLVPLFAVPFADKQPTQRSLLDAVCFACDVMEFGGPQIFGLVYEQSAVKYIQLVQNELKSEDTDLLQSVCFGLGVIA